METTRSLTFMQIVLLLNCLVMCILPVLLTAQISGTSSIKDSNGENLIGTPKKGEVYTVEFTGQSIKDIHIKLGDENATVCCHPGGMPDAPSGCNIDVYPGSFTGCGTHTTEGVADSLVDGEDSAGKYISLWKGGGAIESGTFEIRFNSGTPGTTPVVIFTSDGDADPYDGAHGTDWKIGDGSAIGPTLLSIEEIPTLSEWGVIILILLTLSVGMIFVSKRETALGLAGTMSTGTSASKSQLFDKRLFAKVFGVVLLIGFGLLGLSYLYFGEITFADPFGTFVSSAIVAYMVHFWILKKPAVRISSNKE